MVVRLRERTWMKDRAYRVLHRDTPDPHWWTIVDGMAKAGPNHFEAVKFITDEPFRFVGFDIDPMTPFVVHNFMVNDESVPMPYPFGCQYFIPREGERGMMMPPGTSVCLVLRNTIPRPVDFTCRILCASDLA